jgi:DNA invertase Pin-like site-specific DNA recombinase
MGLPKRAPRATTKQPRGAVGYVRISKDRDDESSTTTQEDRIRAYCQAHGLDLVEMIVEPGKSAYGSARNTRPGFARAKGLIASGAAELLVVWKLDRAARNTIDTLELVKELAEHGAQLASVTEHFDTSTPTGELMVTMLAALARMESATKSERLEVWQAHRRTTGAVPTGPRPFGYHRTPTKDGKHSNRLDIDPAEAKIIRKIAKQVLAGKSLRSVTADLAAAGVTGRNGKPFTIRSVRMILLRPTTAGCREVEPGVYVESSEWKPILDRVTWDKLRDMLTDPARRTSTSNRRRWLLNGIATCARCIDDDGEPVAILCKPHKQGPRYSCPKCHVSIEAARTDEVVRRDLLTALDPKAWRRLRRGRPAGQADGGFEEAMAELMEQFVAGDLDGEEMGRLADGLRRQQQAATVPPPPLPDVVDLAEAWPKLDVEQQRLVLSAATESLTIGPKQAGSNRFDETRIVWTPSE